MKLSYLYLVGMEEIENPMESLIKLLKQMMALTSSQYINQYLNITFTVTN